MKNVLRLFGTISLILLLASCVTTQVIPVEQMESGVVNLSPRIRKVALVTGDFRFNIDTLDRYARINNKLKKVSKKEYLQADSVAVTKSMDQIRKLMLESGRFDEVFVYPYKGIPTQRGEKITPLSAQAIQSICNESNTDAVVSLEMISYFYSRFRSSSVQDQSGEATAKMTAIWAVYIPNIGGVVDRHIQSEHLTWTEREPRSDKIFELPARSAAIGLVCQKGAETYSKRLLPHWEASNRTLFESDLPDWNKALVLAGKGKWDRAAEVWRHYAQSAKRSEAGKAAMNLAIAQEMLGELNQATKWSKIATEKLTGQALRVAKTYAATLEQLKIRAEGLKKLIAPQN